MRFNGSNYDRNRDDDRLSAQYDRIFMLMQDGKWRALFEISNLTGDPPASISAQLRHMRKARFGSHTVNKRLRGELDGLWEYQLIINLHQDTEDVQREGSNEQRGLADLE